MGDFHDTSGEPEVLGTGDDSPRLADRWNALPRRLRQGVLGFAALALTVTGSLYAVAARPEPPRAPPPLPARPVPYPAQVTTITFAELRPPAENGERGFRIELQASTSGKSPVTIEKITQGYEALRVGLDPPGPYTLAPLKPMKLFVRVEVLSCRGLPLGASMPFLDITLRNKRAEQELSVIPGERYALALTRRLRTLCGLPEPSTTPST